MKILHICDWYRPFGGAEKLMFDTLSAIEEKGHTNIMVINEHPSQNITGKRKEFQVKHIEIDFSNFRLFDYVHIYKCIKQIMGIIDTAKPDICHIHNCQNPYVIKALLKKIPCVRSIHDPRLYCFTQWRLLPDKSVCPYPLGKKCIENKCLSDDLKELTYHDKIAPWVYKNYLLHRGMPVIIIESHAQIECLLQNGYDANKIELLPNFTPIKSESEVTDFNNKYYNPTENNILFVGRASYEKGLDVLLDCAKLIKSPVTIHMLTDGPYMDHIKSRIRQENLESMINTPGALSYEDTREYYAKADAVIVPSVWIESFCLVGIEAMANKKPVIGSKIGGIKDWLIDGKTGYHFECANPVDLASKIDILLNDKQLAARMGENGFKRVNELYNKESYINKLIKIYEKGIKTCRL